MGNLLNFKIVYVDCKVSKINKILFKYNTKINKFSFPK